MEPLGFRAGIFRIKSQEEQELLNAELNTLGERIVKVIKANGEPLSFDVLCDQLLDPDQSGSDNREQLENKTRLAIGDLLTNRQVDITKDLRLDLL